MPIVWTLTLDDMQCRFDHNLLQLDISSIYDVAIKLVYILPVNIGHQLLYKAHACIIKRNM